MKKVIIFILVIMLSININVLGATKTTIKKSKVTNNNDIFYYKVSLNLIEQTKQFINVCEESDDELEIEDCITTLENALTASNIINYAKLKIKDKAKVKDIEKRVKALNIEKCIQKAKQKVNTIIAEKERKAFLEAEQRKEEIKKNREFYQDEVIRLVNEERVKNGLKPLVKDARLMQSAKLKAEDMAVNNYISHTSTTPGLENLLNIYKVVGIKYFSAAGENLALGFTNAEAVMQGWMSSEGHRKNILTPEYTKIGVSLDVGKKGELYWVQHFLTESNE
ncbi:MAG: CAP domain-containing protein [Caloramator sp.]|nr:CAP domain-containing protein [Caloramator sp.]